MWTETKSALLSNTRRSFWRSFSRKAEEAIPFMQGASIRKVDAVSKSAGQTGLSWAFAVNRYEAWAELTISLSGDKERSHNVFNSLYAHKADIEAKYGGRLLWDKKDSRKMCNVKSLPREDHGMEDQDRWNELQDKLTDKMYRLERSLSPYFQSI
jgi:hypothetical protein